MAQRRTMGPSLTKRFRSDASEVSGRGGTPGSEEFYAKHHNRLCDETLPDHGTLVEICYVRRKSGHSESVAGLIPDDTIYTKITPKHLEYISRVSHKTRFENNNIFSMGLIPGGSGVTTTALTPTSRPSLRLTIGILLRVGLRVSIMWCSFSSKKS